MRFSQVLVAVAVFSSFGSSREVSAQTAGVKVACAESHERAQLLRNRGQLLEARDHFVACAADECPVLVRKECAELLVRVESDLPTVLIEARDAAGHDLADVRVLVDGRSFRDRLDGMVFAVDPGEHLIRFEANGLAPVEQRLVLQAGEKARRIAVAFGKPDVSVLPSFTPAPRTAPEAASPPARRTSPVVAYVFSSVAAVAMGSFTYFAITGRVQENHLAGSCSPRCTNAEVDPIHRDYIAADISLGVAALAAGGAVWFFAHPRRTASVATVRVVSTPLVGGASVGVSGEFY